MKLRLEASFENPVLRDSYRNSRRASDLQNDPHKGSQINDLQRDTGSEWDGCGLFKSLGEGIGDAGQEEDGEDDGVLCRGHVAFFDQPPEVDEAGAGGDVDEAVESLLVFAPHGAHDEGG